MKRFLHILSSWWLTGTLTVILSIVFIGSPDFRDFLSLIFNHPLTLLLYLILLLNLVLISVRIIGRNMRGGLPDTRCLEGMTSHYLFPSPPEPEGLIHFFRRLGFDPSISGDTGILTRGRYSFLPGTLLRLGLVMILAALMVSFHYREAMERTLHEGDVFTFRGKKGVAERIKPTLPKEFLQVGEKSIFQVDRVNLQLELGGRTIEIDSGLPRSLGGSYFRVSDFGYSHKLGIKKGTDLRELRIDPGVLPPGKTAVIPLTEEDMVITLKMEPVKRIKKGLLTGKLYRFKNLRYKMVLQSGWKKEIKQVYTVTPGTPVRFSLPSLSGQKGDMELLLGPPAYFVKVSMVYDPGIPVLLTGFLFLLTGLGLMPVRFFWYLRRIAWVKTERGLMVGYESEFYRKWAIQKFHNIRIDLFSAPEPGDGKAD